MNTKTQPEYAEVVRHVRNALRHNEMKRTYTNAQLKEWYKLSQDLYPDTENCSFADLRNAFLYGCLLGYEFPAIFGEPRGYDRLQADAFTAGVVHGENCWNEEHEEEIK